MIRIGEESGQLEPMLMQTADILDQETQTLIKRALSLVEPVMTLVLGVIIAEAQRIATFDLSIEPHEDCCSFLEPKDPRITSYNVCYTKLLRSPQRLYRRH